MMTINIIIEDRKKISKFRNKLSDKRAKMIKMKKNYEVILNRK